MGVRAKLFVGASMPLVVLLGTPMAAWAQEAAAESSVQVEEVVVTAQKRSQRLQDVPLSVSAVSQEVLERSRVQTVEDFTGKVPNLTYSEHNASDPQIRIRGIGSDFDGAALERSVAVFVDDVYLGRAAGGTSDLFDLDRVEVLRGPQGTLYGKNTVGGAINFISARPSHSPFARVSATVGDYGTFETRGVFNGSLTDAVAGRLSFGTRRHDGYNVNLNTGNEVDDLNSIALRGSLLFNPGEDVTVILSADGYRRRGAGANRHAINVGNPAFAAAAGPDARHNYLADDGRQNNDTFGVSARVEWDSPLGSVTSITAYRTSESDISLDLGGNRFSREVGAVSAPFGTTNAIKEDASQYSQELRLAGEVGDRFNYVAGVYFHHEDVDRTENTVVFLRASPTDQLNIQAARSKSTSYAVFADATYRFSPQWEVSAGVRWSKDHKEYDQVISGNRFAGLPWVVDEEKDWDAVTPRATLSFKPTSDHMIYATVSRGFKSGGWDGQPTSLAAARLPVDPEYVTNYELGAKTAWFDRRLVLNASAFLMDYTDLQVFTLTTPPGQVVPLSALVNAGSARNAGVEIEATAAITENTNLSVTYGYLDTEITEDLIVSGVNVRGNQFSRAPEHTAGVTLDHTIPLGDNFELGLLGSYSYTSEYFYNVENTAPGEVDSHGIVDASVDLRSLDKNWKLSLWGKNLTDEEYPTHIIIASNTGFARFGAPRTMGVTLTWTFD